MIFHWRFYPAGVITRESKRKIDLTLTILPLNDHDSDDEFKMIIILSF